MMAANRMIEYLIEALTGLTFGEWATIAAVTATLIALMIALLRD